VKREVLQRVNAHCFIGGGGRDEGQAIGIGDRDPGARRRDGLEVCKREESYLSRSSHFCRRFQPAGMHCFWKLTWEKNTKCGRRRGRFEMSQGSR
jgi:hypothetical protein